MALQLRNLLRKEPLYKSYDVKSYSVNDIANFRLNKIDESKVGPDLFTLSSNQKTKTRSLGYVQTSRCVYQRISESKYADLYGGFLNERATEVRNANPETYVIPIKYSFSANITQDQNGKLVTFTATAFIEGIKNQFAALHALDEWLTHPTKIANVVVNMYADDDIKDRDIVIKTLLISDTNDQNIYVNKGELQDKGIALNQIATEMMALIGEALSVNFRFSNQSQLLISETLVSSDNEIVLTSLGFQKSSHTKVFSFYYTTSVEKFRKATAALMNYERSQ
jgi:hypothetical protein